MPPYLFSTPLYFCGPLECVLFSRRNLFATVSREPTAGERAGYAYNSNYYVVKVKYAGFYFLFSAAVAGLRRLVSTS